jgi:hypothetical protein
MNAPVTGFIFSVLFPHQGWWYEDFREFGEKRLQVNWSPTIPIPSIIQLCNAVRLAVWMQAVYCWLCLRTSSQSCQDKQDDEHNVMHSLTNFTSRTPVAAMAIP